MPQENIELNCARNGNMIPKSARSNGKCDPTAGRVSTQLVRFRCLHMPKSIYNTSKLKQMMLDAQIVKEERRRNIRGREKQNPRRNGARSLWRSKHDSSFLFGVSWGNCVASRRKCY
ncbi:hypothetical protein BS47DRAFT_37369 [Hydnum rufescens UP504]|uniref:Sof1-like protein domain-containing protein n=1 Tax=Hydnum rufescens UP504 TaxID=1448309 RepID=A0A9P6AS12_9AGAM|nr:hypothetical protein BS47DRAFT_37369 [Hydnum rufescens UP504]